MPNPNLIIIIFILWMLGFRALQTWCEYVEIRRAGANYEKGEMSRLRDIYFWVYVIVGGVLFGLAVVAGLLGN